MLGFSLPKFVDPLDEGAELDFDGALDLHLHGLLDGRQVGGGGAAEATTAAAAFACWTSRAVSTLRCLSCSAWSSSLDLLSLPSW